MIERKVAQYRDFYHVTRLGTEERILREGLDPKCMNEKWEKPKRHKAIFLWGSYESAMRAIHSEAFNGLLDGALFRVRIPENWVQSDTTYVNPELDEPTDRYVCFRLIPPECLEIV
jgi:hypothetical protein